MKKTAYGMRISDWRSDGCSSDLRGSASQEKRSANFFITKAQLKALHAALDRYEGHKSGKRPRRFNLFETVTSFRLATVDDLWTGQMDMLPDGEQVVEWEVWVRLGAQNLFNRYLDRLGLATSGEPTVFVRSDEHTSDLQSLKRISYAVFCF